MTLLQDFAAEAARRHPRSVALVMGETSLTYAELEAASNRLANILRAGGCESGSRVALFLPKGCDAVIGMLGAMKAGGMYVPIDVTSPASRVAKILASVEPSAVLLAGRSAPLYRDVLATLPSPRAPRVVLMDATDGEIEGIAVDFHRLDLAAAPDETPPCRGVDTDPTHILFTSGSTGVPKGVMVTHRSVVAFVQWALDHFGISADDRNSGHSPFHFDLSTLDIYGTLAAGARLHLVPPEVTLLPQKLAAFIRGSELTQWFSVPSALNYMAKFDVLDPGDFPRLRRVLWCGEVLPTPTLVYWMDRVPHATFTNLYGPTEATIASSYYTVPQRPVAPLDPLPIGTACRGERLRVLDAELRPVPTGVVGDLYIEGVGLSPGYWNDQENTEAVFLRHPFSQNPSGRIYRTGDLAKIDEDGLIRFLGRIDSQIKSRGHRIELGEIEAALHSMDRLRESAVVAVETDGFEGVAICCAYVPLAERNVMPATLSSALRKIVPRYMIPARWKVFDALPRNANGKIDRKRLREEFERHVAETR